MVATNFCCTWQMSGPEYYNQKVFKLSYLYYKYDGSNKYGKWYDMKIIRLPQNNNLVNTSLIKTFQLHHLDNELNSGF